MIVKEEKEEQKWWSNKPTQLATLAIVRAG
jgi:hypothetical protein